MCVCVCVCALCVLEVGLGESESVPELEAKRWRGVSRKRKAYVEVLQPLNHSVVLYEFVKYMGMDMDIFIFPGISPRGMCGSQEDAILLF